MSTRGYSVLGRTGLHCTKLGFGCYRVDDVTPEHEAALRLALSMGCTLIDTSTNYTDGGSERLVGRMLRELADHDPASRRNVVVVSKIGYVQGENLRLAMQRERAGQPFPEMVRYAEGCWHCIHPDFLRDQLERSLERLQLQTLDVCLLHNPEYFLMDAAHRQHLSGAGRAAALEHLRDEFYRRVTAAFGFFEQCVRDGKIRWYGVSSNTVVSPPDAPDATSVERFVRCAQAAAGGSAAAHHFGVLQLPFNLIESGALLQRNTGPLGAGQPPTQTALECAAAHGLGVLVNRPLNAFTGSHMVRLAADPAPALLADAQRVCEQLAAPRLAGALLAPLQALADRRLTRSRCVEALRAVLHQAEDELGPAAVQRWAADAMPALERALEGLGLDRRRAQAVERVIDPLLHEARRSAPLQQKALWLLASVPQVSCVLLGMRRPSYVQDAWPVQQWAPAADVRRVFEAVRASSDV